MHQVYIGHIEISPKMAGKLAEKHRLTPDDVRDACQAPARYRSAVWHTHEEYGRRLIVTGFTRDGRCVKVILQAVDPLDGTWRIRTAVVAG